MLGTTGGRRFLGPSGSQTHHQQLHNLHPLPRFQPIPNLWPVQPTLSASNTGAVCGRVPALEFQTNGEGKLISFSFPSNYFFSFVFFFSFFSLFHHSIYSVHLHLVSFDCLIFLFFFTSSSSSYVEHYSTLLTQPQLCLRFHSKLSVTCDAIWSFR